MEIPASGQPVLSDDLIMEILSWLPVIYLLQFSKRSLLKYPSSTIFVQGANFPLKDKYWVIGSCNGLICLQGSTFEDGEIGVYKHDSGEYWFRFWNPTIGLRSKKSPLLCVDFDHFDSIKYGFGYDKLSGTYKVVAILSNTNAKEDSEKYQQFLLPDGLDEAPINNPTLVVLMDCLCVSYDYKTTHFVLWQMKEFGIEKSWTQLVNVSYEHLQIQRFPFHGPRLYSSVPLCISENGDVLMLIDDQQYETILYNMRDNKVQHTDIPKNRFQIFAEDYVESLVLPWKLRAGFDPRFGKQTAAIQPATGATVVRTSIRCFVAQRGLRPLLHRYPTVVACHLLLRNVHVSECVIGGRTHDSYNWSYS
ncbi:hypothetical protein Lal_00011975 [Lupinus albus]|nr:hypothetical protein Lal_00011975 [Lupinus albus]